MTDMTFQVLALPTVGRARETPASAAGLTAGFPLAPLEAILVAGPAFLAAGGLATAMVFARCLAFEIAPELVPAMVAAGTTLTGVLLVALVEA